MKIAVVVGTRPQLIKLAVLGPALARRGLPFFVVHTGQHYDFALSTEIIEEFRIPIDHNLDVGSHPWEAQVELGVSRLVPHLREQGATHVIVIGDSTPAIVGAEAAKKLNLPVIHCESGLRSYDLHSFEEINRQTIDRFADLHLCSSQDNFVTVNDERHGANPIRTGDLLVDVFHEYRHLTKTPSALPDAIRNRRMWLLTMHREENTVDQNRLGRILYSVLASCDAIVVWPVHPRLSCFASYFHGNVSRDLADRLVVIPPASYPELNYIREHAELVITDSVGLQVESYLWRLPCIAVRDRIEHRKLKDIGATITVSPSDAASPSMRRIVRAACDINWRNVPFDLFGKPGVADRMAACIEWFVYAETPRYAEEGRYIEVAAEFGEFAFNRRLKRQFI